MTVPVDQQSDQSSHRNLGFLPLMLVLLNSACTVFEKWLVSMIFPIQSISFQPFSLNARSNSFSTTPNMNFTTKLKFEDSLEILIEHPAVIFK